MNLKTKHDIDAFLTNLAVIGACISIIVGIFTSDDIEAIRRFVFGFGVLWYVRGRDNGDT